MNECGTFIGDYAQNISRPLTPAQQELVDAGQRLATSVVHECPCALAGRAHIVNGTTDDVYDWAAVEDEWGAAYTLKARETAATSEASAQSVMSDEEAAVYSAGTIFGQRTPQTLKTSF